MSFGNVSSCLQKKIAATTGSYQVGDHGAGEGAIYHCTTILMKTHNLPEGKLLLVPNRVFNVMHGLVSNAIACSAFLQQYLTISWTKPCWEEKANGYTLLVSHCWSQSKKLLNMLTRRVSKQMVGSRIKGLIPCRWLLQMKFHMHPRWPYHLLRSPRGFLSHEASFTSLLCEQALKYWYQFLLLIYLFLHTCIFGIPRNMLLLTSSFIIQM